MTWFCRAAAFWATLLLLGYTLEVLGYTLSMCKQDCKDQPDDPVCGRWNFTMEDQARTKSADYQWLRNPCERKCFYRGKYEKADMDLCYRKGQNQMSYICSKHKHPKNVKRCMRNETTDD